ncbi:bifunctional adenosylcobinamide kinase/adenosylcobinamide-phosphate guanylyltransferase [Sphingomonas sp. ABOLD]|uniref:Bifunctional adenosylcobalamin biosynthesis protein n=1 Tax=Sphingomonas trueperi TaxID=53317 RepID=A0A7X5Y154_9SPHN|nr:MULTISPECIES: bifunctional adenosylcobinamide kinase/adenosylcobinamide-phosphate guanylyltransferase [Sphingomonas]NJB97536.1 adenosylcobinamide kinase/adenosylcobinamide-phosphate guanylyltransferase [Sphingomonas trueperi]RSV50042.1 bifunctional adenosylcobinamide kinase/adenosylcobinamide-phosphate guanylyltransferase [Sphingomonas sp. ABOLD]
MTSLFVLGGARSGKSRYAQARAESLAGDLLYLATAQAFDAEMEERIARHRADRGPRWSTLDVPLDLPAAILANAAPGRVLLVDCLTLWTSNLMFAERDLDAETEALATAVTQAAGPVILVANEVGLGIVPDNALARRFRDAAGRINQAIAATADEVQFIAAGLPLPLK